MTTCRLSSVEQIVHCTAFVAGSPDAHRADTAMTTAAATTETPRMTLVISYLPYFKTTGISFGRPP
jgi:hypothetical protein